MVVLAVLLVAVRWGDRARSLFTWDAHTFAIALEDYNVRGLHPHAPGYPLYVALGKLATFVWPDANDAYVALSLAFTAAACAMLYGLSRAVANRAVALASLSLLLAAPLVYVHSVTATVYTADMACSLAVAWAAWACHHDPTRRRALALAVLFAIAVGIRPSIILFLLPVVAWGALRPPWSLREQSGRLLPAAVAGAAVALAWFIPMTQASGGLAGWRQANSLQTDFVVFGHTAFSDGLPILKDNVARLVLFLRWELLWVVPALVGAVVFGWAFARRTSLAALPQTAAAQQKDPRRTRAAFLALWALPSLLFYALIFDGWNDGPSGYALVVLPVLLLAAVLAVGPTVAAVVRRAPSAAVVLASLLVLVPAVGLASHAHDIQDLDYKAHDAWVEAWSHLPEAFPPTNSSIVAWWQFAHVWYAFPAYTSYDYRPAAQGPGETPDFLLIQEAKGRKASPDWYDEIAAHKTAGPHPLANGTKHLVLFDFQLAGENGGPRQVRPEIPVREAFLPSGWRVLVVDTTPDRPLLEDYFTMEGTA